MTTLSKPIAQKIQKVKKTKSGKTVLSKKQIGYIIAAVADDERVTIGYSLCHKNDRYDFVDGRRRPGFGRELALARAIKWSSQDSIEVPASIMPFMKKFVARCESYYKDKSRPDIKQQDMKPKAKERAIWPK